MFNSRRLKLIEAFKAKVSVPYPNVKQGTSFYYPTPDGGRFVYNTISARHSISISSPLAAAVFLKKHNLIHTYTVSKEGDVRMYVVNTLACGPDEVIHWKDPQMIRWQDFEFTREQVEVFAAVNEMEMEHKKQGILVSMFKKPIFKRVA